MLTGIRNEIKLISMIPTLAAARNLLYTRAYNFASIGAGGFILPFLTLF